MGIVILNQRSVDDLVADKNGVVESYIVGFVEGIGRHVDLDTHRSATRFGMDTVVVEDTKEHLVALDERIVAVGGRIDTIAIGIIVGCQLGCIPLAAVAGPCKDVLGNLVARGAHMGDEIVDIGASDRPDPVEVHTRLEVIGVGTVDTDRAGGIVASREALHAATQV